MRYCSIEGCNNKHSAKGYCGKHYIRILRHGDPNIVLKKQGNHGYSYHPLYGIWRAMKSRCYNKNNKKYKYYGGRGIAVCVEWYFYPQKFIEWAFLNGYKKGLTLDRINNDSDYCPENCRFISFQKNNNNQRLLRSSNTSGYRGVDYYTRLNKFRSRIRMHGKKVTLGYFKSAKLAAIRYDVEAYLLNDERPMNFIDRV